ncbi:MAG: DUF6572 domain-containing protein [Kiritimatiellales bacterium]|jgi:hypothetical protein
MSTVADSDKIDIVTSKEEISEVKLIMVEVRSWKDVDLLELQEKFKTYLAFVEEGHLLEQFPKVKGFSVIIRLDSVEPPPRSVMKFIDEVKKLWLAPLSIRFEYGVLSWTSESGTWDKKHE